MGNGLITQGNKHQDWQREGHSLSLWGLRLLAAGDGIKGAGAACARVLGAGSTESFVWNSRGKKESLGPLEKGAGNSGQGCQEVQGEKLEGPKPSWNLIWLLPEKAIKNAPRNTSARKGQLRRISILDWGNTKDEGEAEVLKDSWSQFLTVKPVVLQVFPELENRDLISCARMITPWMRKRLWMMNFN